MSEKPEQGVTRRQAPIAGGTAAVGAAMAAVATTTQAQVPEKPGAGPVVQPPDRFSTVPLNMVPTLSAQNLVPVEIGKDFMRSHGYIQHDFDVRKWAAPEFLEQAARELLESEWKRKTQEKLPEGTTPRLG